MFIHVHVCAVQVWCIGSGFSSFMTNLVIFMYKCNVQYTCTCMYPLQGSVPDRCLSVPDSRPQCDYGTDSREYPYRQELGRNGESDMISVLDFGPWLASCSQHIQFTMIVTSHSHTFSCTDTCMCVKL